MNAEPMTADPPRRRSRWLSLLLRTVAVAMALGGVFLLVAYIDARPSLGRAPAGDRLARIQSSPQWDDGSFVNRLPQRMYFGRMLGEYRRESPHVVPATPLPTVDVASERFSAPPQSGLRVTWLGHSITLIEIDGHTILTDPVWGPRASPWSWMGPEAWYDPLIALEDLPPIDAVLISHDHYDHLDHPTIAAMREWDTRFLVPLGVGAHLEAWGVPPDRIVELDWWDGTSLGEVDIVMTPARHASGRHFFDRDRTLWAGYALRGPEHRVFYSGDTGPFPEIADIGERLGPFDVTMIEVAAYSQAWPDWHMGPEQAVQAHEDLGGSVLLPIHWGLFNLSTHGWTEPIERVLAAAVERGVTALTLRPGASYEAGSEVALDRWWPDLAWRTSAEYPMVSSMDEPGDGGS